jgi:type I restriction enzyme M protein
MDDLFNDWKKRNTIFLKALTVGIKPKQIIHTISEDVLQTYTSKALINKYDVYQHLMNYWNEVMQDDCYLIAVDGWKAEPQRIIVTTKTKGKEEKKVDKGWECDLVPKNLVINRYFSAEQQAIDKQENQMEVYAIALKELEEDNGEGGIFEDFEKVNKLTVQRRLKELEAQQKKSKKKQNSYEKVADPEAEYDIKEISTLKQYLKIADDYSVLSTLVKTAKIELDQLALKRYQILTENDIKQLVVDDKWMTNIERSIKTEMERISQRSFQDSRAHPRRISSCNDRA